MSTLGVGRIESECLHEPFGWLTLTQGSNRFAFLHCRQPGFRLNNQGPVPFYRTKPSALAHRFVRLVGHSNVRKSSEAGVPDCSA